MTVRRHGPLTAEQQALASDPRHLAMASRIAEHFAREFPRLADEFASEAFLALCQSTRTFVPARKVKFSTHAVTRINGAMIEVLRLSGLRGYRRRGRSLGEKAIPRIESLDAIRAENDAGRTLSRSETLAADDEPIGWEAESLDELKRLTRSLPVKHRTVLRLLYGHAETKRMRVAGMAIGASESWVSQLHSEAIAMLRG